MNLNDKATEALHQLQMIRAEVCKALRLGDTATAIALLAAEALAATQFNQAVQKEA